jgi:hypothetical protein
LGGFGREQLSTRPRRRSTPAAQRSHRRSWTARRPPWGRKNQFDPRKRGTPNESVRNKANFQAVAEADADGRGRWRSRRWDGLYKRTQFALHRHRKSSERRGRTHHRLWGQSRQTKPISSVSRSWQGTAELPTPLPPGQSVPNEPNLPRADRKARIGNAATAENECAKQSQFLPRAAQRISTLWEESYDAWDA